MDHLLTWGAGPFMAIVCFTAAMGVKHGMADADAITLGIWTGLISLAVGGVAIVLYALYAIFIKPFDTNA